MLNRVTIILSFAGMYVAGVLSIAHIYGRQIACGAGTSCDALAKDPSSRFLGIPVAIYGFAAYFVLAVLAFIRLRSLKGSWTVTAGRLISGLGAVASIVLTYYSLRILRLVCPWCIASAGLMITLFVLHEVLAWKQLPRPHRLKADAWLVAGLSVVLGAAIGAHYVLGRPMPQAIATSALEKVPYEALAPHGAHSLGPADAPVTVVVFSDLMCAACRTLHPEMKRFVQEMNGRARLIFRHLPQTDIKGHESSEIAAILAEMAGAKGRFWDFVDRVFASPTPPTQAELERIARDLGVMTDTTSMQPFASKVAEDLNLGNQMGLKSTPIFVVVSPGYKARAGDAVEFERIISEEPYSRLLQKKG